MKIAIGSDPNAVEEKYRLIEFIKKAIWVKLQILEVMMQYMQMLR